MHGKSLYGKYSCSLESRILAGHYTKLHSVATACKRWSLPDFSASDILQFVLRQSPGCTCTCGTRQRFQCVRACLNLLVPNLSQGWITTWPKIRRRSSAERLFLVQQCGGCETAGLACEKCKGKSNCSWLRMVLEKARCRHFLAASLMATDLPQEQRVEAVRLLQAARPLDDMSEEFMAVTFAVSYATSLGCSQRAWHGTCCWPSGAKCLRPQSRLT